MLVLAAVLSMVHLEGDVTSDGGDYAEVMFQVPPGTREIQIAHGDGSDSVVLDFGVWDHLGTFRGWGGGNAEDIVIGVQESSRSYRIGGITEGTWRVVIGKAKLGPTGGRYTLDITCRDDDTLPVRPRAGYEPVVLDTESRWYKGDFHVHSSESGDANASYPQIAALAASRGLDFVLLSEHNTDAQLPLQAAAQTASPDVLFLRGAEITTYDGHANVVGTRAYVDHRIGLRGRSITDVIGDVTFLEGLVIVNHPVLELGDSCIGCAWNHPTTPWAEVDAMEITTGKWEVVEGLFVGRAIALWDSLLDQGFRITAVSGSDDHRAGLGTGATDTPIGSPTTLVYSSNLSESGIVLGIQGGKAIVQLRGPDDPAVDFTVDGLPIGSHLTNRKAATPTVRVVGGQGMFAGLWRDGVKLTTVRVDRDDFTHAFPDVPGPFLRRYRIELIDEVGRRIVVTNHIYVDGVLDDGRDTGCNTTPATPGGALGLVGLVVLTGLGLSQPRRTRAPARPLPRRTARRRPAPVATR